VAATRRRVEELKEFDATIRVLKNLIRCGANGRISGEVQRNKEECTEIIKALYEKVKERKKNILE